MSEKTISSRLSSAMSSSRRKNRNRGVHKIIMVGCGGVGKSALTIQFMYDEFVADYEPSKVSNYRKKIELDGEKVFIDIVDTAGEEEYAAVRDNLIRTGEGFLCCFSVMDKYSYVWTQDFREQILRVKGADSSTAADIPFLLVGNKCDVDGAERQVSEAEALQMADKMGVRYVETSAKTRQNLEEVFLGVLRMIKEQKKKHMVLTPQEANKNDKKKTTKKRRCPYRCACIQVPKCNIL